MQIEINEHITKSNPWVTLSISNNQENVGFHKFEGVNCDAELEQYLKSKSDVVKNCTELNFYRTNRDLSILSQFKSLTVLSVRGGKVELKIGNIDHLEKLNTIYINDQSNPANLKGIESLNSLEKLYIGDFSFGKPVVLMTMDYLIESKSIKELFFSNAVVGFNELKKLISMKNLEDITLSQKYEFEQFAELSVILPNVRSRELKPWQNCLTEKGDIKINGKRKPYLDSKLHSDRIKKYEKQFKELQMKYAV